MDSLGEKILQLIDNTLTHKGVSTGVDQKIAKDAEKCYKKIKKLTPVLSPLSQPPALSPSPSALFVGLWT